MQQTDIELINRCKAGDKTAFRIVVQNCQGMVYSLSLKMLADVEEAKDVVMGMAIHDHLLYQLAVSAGVVLIPLWT